MLFLDVPYQQKGCAIHAPPCCETGHRVQIKKRSQNAQPQNEILCSKGLGGTALNKQFVAKWIATSIACHNMLRIK